MRSITTHRFTRIVMAALVLTSTSLAHASTSTGSGSVPTQTIDGITFPASFPAGALNSLKVSNAGAIPLAADARPVPRNTTSITPDLYVPGKIKGVNGEPPLAHCRNLANGNRQCVTPAPEGGW